jgi:hypothetical protein
MGTSEMENIQYDGPYVWYRNGQVHITSVWNAEGKLSVKEDSLTETEKKKVVLTVPTDQPGVTFSFPLKEKIQEEKSDYKKATRQFVVSDIEGNFAAFRKLLLAGGVIDEKFNWTFGEGHLVLTGDFVDRGAQVTEVLWLIYSLEDKARDKGGYVHYILGNHEIMNLSGDGRYVHQKYKDVSELLQTPLISLYGENTELGKWLRSKNIVERIGDMLYVHGGISRDINTLGMSVKEINELSRPFYADTTYQYPDPRLGVIYMDNGPFWYRGYYSSTPGVAMSQIDSTLEFHRVRHVITGHTLISDTISSWFRGKVINADVHHARGHSEALLIKGKEFFRITPTGEQIPLVSK